MMEIPILSNVRCFTSDNGDIILRLYEDIITRPMLEHTVLITQMEFSTIVSELSQGKWEVVVSWCTLAETVINATGFIEGAIVSVLYTG